MILNLVFSTVILVMVVVAKNPNGNLGLSGMRAEDSIPYVMYNAGYYSEKPIYTTSTLRAGGTLTLDGAATVGTTLTVTGNTTLTGTSTITKSPDGFIAYGAFDTSATGTARAAYTNAAGPMMCHGGSFYITSSDFAPALIWSIGTTTSATGYSATLLASSTIATTSSNGVLPIYTSPFFLDSGESVTGSISDPDDFVEASSTNYANWSAEFSLHCWLLGE